MSRRFFEREILPIINRAIFIVACVVAAIVCLPADLYDELKRWVKRRRKPHE